MIVELEGKITFIDPTFVHIKVGGITYKVFVSVQTSTKLSKKVVILNITQIIKEDSANLYGFVDEEEKKLFDILIKINGVGPSTAMAVCSTFSAKEFLSAVYSNDIRTITMVPGIGPKSAKRILVELGDAAINFNSEAKPFIAESTMALESLGFKKDKINRVFKECISQDTASLVKEALKKLAK